ncbi:MAG: hypothetical protein ACRD2I_21050 [Vicinamibacterales bacterium]
MSWALAKTPPRAHRSAVGGMVAHFDASLYFANWLFLDVAFRYPKVAVDVKALRRYPV